MSTAALLIDFGGTLDADGVPWVDRFFTAYQRAGGKAGFGDFRVAFTESDEQLARVPGIRTCGYTDTVSTQRDLLVPMLADGECLEEPRVTAGLVGDAKAAAARNVPVLEQLQESYRLAVVSNFQGNLQPCLDELGLGEIFDVVSDSEIVGARKPDARIFSVTLDELGATAADAWMVGDSPPNDIAAATALGMRSCWIAPLVRPLPGICPTARIARFADLPSAVAP